MNNINIKYLPLKVVAEIYNIKASTLRSMYYKNLDYNSIRFKKINNELLVALNYQNPLFDFVTEKYTEALKLAPNENSLVFQLSNISGITKDSIYRVLHRFKFSQFNTVVKYIVLFDRYIDLQKTVEKLYIEALSYDEDINILAKKLSLQSGIKIPTMKISLLNDIHKINLYHLQTILEEYLYAQRIKNATNTI